MKTRVDYAIEMLKGINTCPLFVDKTGHLANDTPCDLVMMEKATFMDFDLSEKISQERRTGHANKA